MKAILPKNMETCRCEKSGFKKAASPHQGEAAHNKSRLFADKDCAIRMQSQARLNYAEAMP